MKKLLLPMLVLLLALGLALPTALPVAADLTGNLLVNPGAETGDTSGWTLHGSPVTEQSIQESCVVGSTQMQATGSSPWD